jgi:hypothetical protein
VSLRRLIRTDQFREFVPANDVGGLEADDAGCGELGAGQFVGDPSPDLTRVEKHWAEASQTSGRLPAIGIARAEDRLDIDS